MNRVFVVGNITGDIYFDRFLMKGKQRSFLRLILMAERPRSLRGIRVVLWDEKAELYYPYLKKGSGLAVIGQIESRQYKEKWVQEVISESLLLLRNIDWERGESLRQQYNLPSPNGTSNDVFVIGEVLKGIIFDHYPHKPETGVGEFALLRLRLKSNEHLDGLRVIVLGALAELVYPYLQVGSRIAVDGSLSTRNLQTGKKVVEVTARNMTFLENINWTAGEASRKLRTENISDPSQISVLVEDWVISQLHGD